MNFQFSVKWVRIFDGPQSILILFGHKNLLPLEYVRHRQSAWALKMWRRKNKRTETNNTTESESTAWCLLKINNGHDDEMGSLAESEKNTVLLASRRWYRGGIALEPSSSKKLTKIPRTDNFPDNSNRARVRTTRSLQMVNKVISIKSKGTTEGGRRRHPAGERECDEGLESCLIAF